MAIPQTFLDLKRYKEKKKIIFGKVMLPYMIGAPLIPFDINWETTAEVLEDDPFDPLIVPENYDPWVISENGTSVRFNITDSTNCLLSGSDPNSNTNGIQNGTATATINTGSNAVDMNLTFEGMGEGENSEFEKIKFFLSGGNYIYDVNDPLADGQADGQGLGCQMLPIISTYNVPPPYRLESNTEYKFIIDFTTNDGLYHVGGYYQIDLSFDNV